MINSWDPPTSHHFPRLRLQNSRKIPLQFALSLRSPPTLRTGVRHYLSAKSDIPTATSNFSSPIIEPVRDHYSGAGKSRFLGVCTSFRNKQSSYRVRIFVFSDPCLASLTFSRSLAKYCGNESGTSLLGQTLQYIRTRSFSIDDA